MNRKSIGATCLLLAIVIATVLVSSNVSLAELPEREQSLRQQITEHPVLSWVLGFFIYLGLSLIPGTRGKAVAFGWLFGFWPGLVLVNVALTVAALICFHLSRSFIRDAVESRYALRLEKVNQALAKDGAFYVLLIRITPVPFSVTNYVLGATNLHWRSFWWATQIGLLPSNIVFVNLGAQLPSLREIYEIGIGAIFQPDLILSLVCLSAFTLLIPPLVRRWNMRRSASG